MGRLEAKQSLSRSFHLPVGDSSLCAVGLLLSSSCSEPAAKHLFFFFFVSIHFGHWSKVELNQKLMSVKSMLDSLNVGSGVATNQWYVGASLASPNPAPVCAHLYPAAHSGTSCGGLELLFQALTGMEIGTTGFIFFFRKLVIKELSAH